MGTRLTFWLVALLVLGGLVLRSLPDGETGDKPADREIRASLSIARFLAENGLPGARWVHYTKDSGIRGLQIELPDCRGNLQITVMPEGDEFLSLWESRAMRAEYVTAYLFNRELYPEFPLYSFWWKAMNHALARRLRIIENRNPGAVFALAYPANCQLIQRLPWHNT